MTIIAMVQLDSDDPRLDPEKISVATAADAAALRAAVIQAYPQLTRVIAVMTEAESRLMMLGHEAALRKSGIRFDRPPPDYKPPGGPGQRDTVFGERE